ncbi:hypothetical protein [Cohnella algarum]|uniref:hypothetical protein n=1 Tax=Cohnella algarum TaxID=2044859 RepID=UPI001968182E|nr:hypothetical protein [Cohnella algarum]MBN2983028.1 hypothetical protein [Cohnella algarum]
MAKLLEPSRFEAARQFMKRRARPLERAVYEHEFESGSESEVLKELAEFQNPDGGFGCGLEPDLRCKESSALATTRALDILEGMPPSDEKLATARKALATQSFRTPISRRVRSSSGSGSSRRESAKASAVFTREAEKSARA